MGLLNKKEKSAAIHPRIQSGYWIWKQDNLRHVMKDEKLYWEWIDLISSNDNEDICLDKWIRKFYSIASNFIHGPKIICTHRDNKIVIGIEYVVNGKKCTGLTVTCILDEDYPEELIEKIIQDSKHSGALSDID